MKVRHVKLYVLAAVTAAALSTAIGYAQSTQHDPATPQATQGAPMDHQAMMAGMDAQQKKLDALVAQMNAATGQDKVDKIAAVVNEMAAMHKQMHSMMMMHGGAAQMPHDMPRQRQ